VKQRLFPFAEHALRRQKGFKQAIALATLVVMAALVLAVPRARYLAASAASRTQQIAAAAIGRTLSRAEIEAGWERDRRHGMEETRREFDRVFPEIEPAYQRLMTYAGNDPKTGVIRWGNFDRTLLLPSRIFEPDDHGRSYRLRPNTRAVWLRNLSVRKIPLTFFLVPDGPGLAAATEGTTAILVEGATQTTNSWGLRGPEPDLAAQLRGIILGDSFIQGLFIGDRDTPSECLSRLLAERCKGGVSALNTGHLGYSPEQEYHTLLEYGDRFQPSFVILSLFANDFGEVYDVLAGRGDWDEGKYWIDRIAAYCEQRGIVLLTVTAPLESQITARPLAGFYPGKIVDILEASGTHHVDVAERFVNTHLRMMLKSQREGRRPQSSPLYNGAIADHHYSPAGSECWAQAVAGRLLPLLTKAGKTGSS